MYDCFACMDICELCVCSAYRGQKKALNFLELELAVVSYHVGARNRTWVFWKGNKCSQLLSHLPAPLTEV